MCGHFEVSFLGGTLSDQNLFAVLDPISHLSFFQSHFDRGEFILSEINRIIRNQPKADKTKFILIYILTFGGSGLFSKTPVD
jgi:hypothetical protein